jgi:hypothetical protein
VRIIDCTSDFPGTLHRSEAINSAG